VDQKSKPQHPTHDFRQDRHILADFQNSFIATILQRICNNAIIKYPNSSIGYSVSQTEITLHYIEIFLTWPK